jgi:hypothetical protein
MGLSSLTLPSIEKRFSLTSKELGVILASNDVIALVVVLFISFYGDYANKIRWIGGGGVILSKLGNHCLLLYCFVKNTMYIDARPLTLTNTLLCLCFLAQSE